MPLEDADEILNPGGDDTSASKFTYRDLRLLSQYSINSPLRVIALIDFDCFYAQCERVRLGLPEGRPLGVQQFKHVIATNYEARAAGLKKVVTAVEARRLCPDIVLQHVPTWREGDTTWRYRDDALEHMSEDKSSLDYYRLQSRRAIELVKSILPAAPLQKVEKASIDEVFIDLSAQVHAQLLARFPDLLGTQAADLDIRLPKPWTELLDWHDDKLVEIGSDDVNPEVLDWDDVGFNIGSEIIRDIRKQIHEKLHYTCSAGIARNKTIAKLAAGHNKPNKQTIITNISIVPFLSDYKFTKLRGLGGKLGNRVAQAFSTEQLSELLDVPLKSLQHEVGAESGSWVFQVIRGIENSEVTPRTQIQSMLSAKTFDPGIQSLQQAEKWLQIFAADIIGRLEEQEGRRPKTIAVHHHINGRFGPVRSKQSQLPVTCTLDIHNLAKLAREILSDITREGQSWPCWNLSVCVSDFFDIERNSHSITSMFAAQQSTTYRRPVEHAEAEPGLHIPKTVPRKRTIMDFGGAVSLSTGTQDHLASPQGHGNKRQRYVSDVASERPHSEHTPELPNNDVKYSCPTCSASVPADAVLEHLDWHVAFDLQHAQ